MLKPGVISISGAFGGKGGGSEMTTRSQNVQSSPSHLWWNSHRDWGKSIPRIAGHRLTHHWPLLTLD